MSHRVDVAELEAAWRWVLRLRDEDATQEDLTEWLRWYQEDERHRVAFEEMQSFWHESGRLVGDDESASVAALLAGRASTLDEQPQPNWQQRRWPALAASLLIVTATLGWVVSAHWTTTSQAIAEVHQTALPDGSTIDLAAKSSVSSRYSEDMRLLVMEGQSGEAYFSVAHNPQRPFVVQVGTMRVRALGTAFNVRHADDRVVVSVTKGVVEVSAPGGSVKVTAGSRIVWNESGDATPSILPATAESTLAWQQGRLEYHNEPLAAVIADVNRYSRQSIVIEDEAAGQILFSGTVFTRATDAWIDALPQVFPVQLEPRLAGGLLLKMRE
jgi:transmembrane sensor